MSADQEMLRVPTYAKKGLRAMTKRKAYRGCLDCWDASEECKKCEDSPGTTYVLASDEAVKKVRRPAALWVLRGIASMTWAVFSGTVPEPVGDIKQSHKVPDRKTHL